MKIPLQDALDLIESADVIKLLDGDSHTRILTFTNPVKGEPDNEVLYVSWEDWEGLEYNFRVCESENAEVERDGHKMTFIDDEGEPFELHLFREVPILP